MAQKLAQLSTQTDRDLELFARELHEATREQGDVSVWVYPHEETRWFSYPGSILLFGPPLFFDDYLEKQEIELLFRGNKLSSWANRVVSRPFEGLQNPNGYQGTAYQTPSTNTWFPTEDAAHHEAEKKALKKHQKKERKRLFEHQKEEGASKAHRKAEKKALKKHQKKERRRLEKH